MLHLQDFKAFVRVPIPKCPVGSDPITMAGPQMMPFDLFFEEFAVGYLTRGNTPTGFILSLSWNNFKWRSINGLIIQDEINLKRFSYLRRP